MGRTMQVDGRTGAPEVNGRVVLTEWFPQRPALNAAVAVSTNLNWEVLGTNMTTALCTFGVNGGITLTTAGASADQAILTPHLDAGQSAFAGIQWNSDDSPAMDVWLQTGSAVTDQIIWCGFKLTNTPVVATDNDQAFFRYEAGVNSGRWQCVSSNNGTDQTNNTAEALAASTIYHLQIVVDSNRKPTFIIDNVPQFTNNALKATVTGLIPYIAIQASAAAAKAITVFPPLTLSRVRG